MSHYATVFDLKPVSERIFTASVYRDDQWPGISLGIRPVLQSPVLVCHFTAPRVGHLRSAGECLPSDFFSPATRNVPLFLMITLPPHCIAIFARKRPCTSRLDVPLSRNRSCSMFVHEIGDSQACALRLAFFLHVRCALLMRF